MQRRYNRWWSRFDQPDPYDGSYELTNPQSFNRYAYTQNDPVNHTDPSGLEMNDSFCGAENSFDQCGGSAGFWGGGSFGGHVAEYNHEYGGLPANIAEAMHLIDQRIGNARGGLGFLTSAEILGRATSAHAWIIVDGVYYDADGVVWSGSDGRSFGGNPLFDTLDQWPPQWPRLGDGYDSRWGWRTQSPPEMEQFPKKFQIEDGKLKFRPEFDPNKVPSNASRSSRYARGALRTLELIIRSGGAGGMLIDVMGPMVLPNTQVKQAACRMSPNNPGCWGPPQ